MEVKLSKQFTKDLGSFAKAVEQWEIDAQRELEHAHGLIGQRWRAEAVKRVPVDEGRLVNAILDNVVVTPNVIETEVGTNVEYGPFLEFGTDAIASGQVKALGTDPHITDKDAITSWPAKHADGEQRTQMPWLRPSFWAIHKWAVKLINACLNPPKQKG